jgi:phage host-nuclease inhibitor protein Gam
MKKMKVKERKVLREKVKDYCEVLADYVTMMFPKSAPPERFTNTKRLESLMKNKKVQERIERLQELQEELEALFLQISEQPKVAREDVEELKLVSDLVWLWEKPAKIVRALENLSLKT